MSDSLRRSIARSAVAACTGFFTVCAAWGLSGPMQSGHWSAMAASAIAGENMLRYRIFAAVARYTPATPAPALYYCHHPYGIFVLEALSYAVFGHHPATVRIVAVVCSALSVPLVYALGFELWRREEPAVVATLAFVLVPVDLCFAGFSSLEVPTIFFGLLFAWTSAVAFRAPTKRSIVLASLGAFGAAQSDWPGLVLIGATAGIVLLRLVSPVAGWRWPTEAAARRRVLLWVLAVGGAAVTTVVLYWVAFARADQMFDLWRSYAGRTGRHISRLGALLVPRRLMWTSWMLTWPGVAVGFLGAGASLARLRQHAAEALPVAWFVMASVQLLLFPAGASVHIFWPHCFGVSIALGTGALFSRALGAADHRHKRLLAAFAFATLAVLARVAWPQLRQSKLTSGRFDEAGHEIEPGADAAVFTVWAVRDLPEEATVLYHPSFPMGANLEYSARRPSRRVDRVVAHAPDDAADGMALLDSRRTPATELRTIASAYDVSAVGPFWRVDRAGNGALRAYRFDEREPGSLEGYFVTGPDLRRSVADDEDPWASWQWRDALGLPAPPPAGDPTTFDERIVAYDVAFATGDSEHLQALRARALRDLPPNPTPSVEFESGAQLLAVQLAGDRVPVAMLVWEMGERATPPEGFALRCKVTGRPSLWPAAIDPYEKTLALPLGLPPALWKPKHLYVQRYVLQHRIGAEACTGAWGDGRAVPLFALE